MYAVHFVPFPPFQQNYKGQSPPDRPHQLWMADLSRLLGGTPWCLLIRTEMLTQAVAQILNQNPPNNLAQQFFQLYKSSARSTRRIYAG